MKPLIHVDTEEDMGGGLMDARLFRETDRLQILDYLVCRFISNTNCKRYV